MTCHKALFHPDVYVFSVCWSISLCVHTLQRQGSLGASYYRIFLRIRMSLVHRPHWVIFPIAMFIPMDCPSRTTQYIQIIFVMLIPLIDFNYSDLRLLNHSLCVALPVVSTLTDYLIPEVHEPQSLLISFLWIKFDTTEGNHLLVCFCCYRSNATMVLWVVTHWNLELSVLILLLVISNLHLRPMCIRVTCGW